MRIHSTTSSISVKAMKPGEIAIITKWGENDQYIGKIIQLIEIDNKLMLIALGEPNCYWDDIQVLNIHCRVEILSPGTLLEI